MSKAEFHQLFSVAVLKGSLVLLRTCSEEHPTKGKWIYGCSMSNRHGAGSDLYVRRCSEPAG